MNLTLKFGIFTHFQEVSWLRWWLSFPGVTIAMVAWQDKLSNINRSWHFKLKITITSEKWTMTNTLLTKQIFYAYHSDVTLQFIETAETD